MRLFSIKRTPELARGFVVGSLTSAAKMWQAQQTAASARAYVECQTLSAARKEPRINFTFTA
jgi:hypothetical protein